jgi:protein-S-isoprenylcysteine O-methyltransferase Ste14
MKLWDRIIIVLCILSLIALSVLAYFHNIILPNWFPTHFAARAFVIICIVWLITELSYFIKGNTNSKNIEEERVSFILILATEVSLIIMIAIASFVSYDMREDNYHIILGRIQHIGLILMLIGIVFRQIAIIFLGKNFTTSVHLKSPNEKQKNLVNKGLYKYIRHPSYTGMILTLIGLPLALGAWAGAIIVFIVSLIAYSFRIKEEERMLVKKFGKEYIEYKKHTWKFFPGY